MSSNDQTGVYKRTNGEIADQIVNQLELTPEHNVWHIFGSRHFRTHANATTSEHGAMLLEQLRQRGVAIDDIDLLVSGGAKGADAAAEAAAIQADIPMLVVTPKPASDHVIFRQDMASSMFKIVEVDGYDTRRDALLARNETMVRVTDRCDGNAFAVDNGTSAGTGHTRELWQAVGGDLQSWFYAGIER